MATKKGNIVYEFELIRKADGAKQIQTGRGNSLEDALADINDRYGRNGNYTISPVSTTPIGQRVETEVMTPGSRKTTASIVPIGESSAKRTIDKRSAEDIANEQATSQAFKDAGGLGVAKKDEVTGAITTRDGSTAPNNTPIDYTFRIGQETPEEYKTRIEQARTTQPTQGVQGAVDTAGQAESGQPDGVITDNVTGNQYVQGPDGSYVPFTGGQTPEQMNASSQVGQPQSYTVQAGDTLNSIAQRLGVNPSDITGYRSGNANLIYPGENLTVRPRATTPQIAPSGTGGSYQPPPAPETTGLNPLTNAMSQYGINFSADEFQLDPVKSIQTLMKDIMKSQDLGSITNEITDLTDDIKSVEDERDDEIRDINNDPWLTEGMRVQRVRKVQEKYDDRLSTKVNQLTLYQNARDDARRQAEYVATTAINLYDANRSFQLDQLKYIQDVAESQLKAQQDLLASQSPDYQYTEVDGSLYQIDKKTGESKVVVQGTPTGTGDGGFSSAQINSTVNQIASSFDNEPIVKSFNVLNEGYQFAKSLSNSTTNPADDQALIYAFAKAMDPNSVVREGEYNTVQKYAQSWVQSYGKSIEQAVAGTGFLSDTARSNIKKTIENRYQSSLQNYNNVYSQYQQRIDAAKSGQGNSLTDYSQFGGGYSPVQSVGQTQTSTQEPKGFLANIYNFMYGND